MTNETKNTRQAKARQASCGVDRSVLSGHRPLRRDAVDAKASPMGSPGACAERMGRVQ